MKQDADSLDVIHITGTKGKGSTAAFTDALLRAHFREHSDAIKVGLYTSPHLNTERERIRFNFRPLSEAYFTTAFFEIWDELQKNREGDMPGYLQLLMLLSWHCFKKERVDIAIYEVHAGGRKDATNIFKAPVACGITYIGMDHEDLLGNSIESIADHKSGIMKRGRPAFSVQQERAVRSVLEREAAKLPCSLEFVDVQAQPPKHWDSWHPVQKQNASLAVRLANAYLQTRDDALTTEDIENGTAQCKWPGRFQMIETGSTSWFLDAAHNSLSLPIALMWFVSKLQDTADSSKRILIFGHESAREISDIISAIANFCTQQEFSFDMIILSPYERYGKHRIFVRHSY